MWPLTNVDTQHAEEPSIQQLWKSLINSNNASLQGYSNQGADFKCEQRKQTWFLKCQVS